MLPLLDQLSLAVAWLDAEGKFVAANRLGLDLFGGYGLPRLRNHPALRKAISARTPLSTDLTHHALQTRHHVRVVPMAAGMLIEARNTTKSWDLERELQALQQRQETSEAVHEELMCAYEQLLSKKEQDACKHLETQRLVEQLFASNAELLLRNRSLAHRLREADSTAVRLRP